MLAGFFYAYAATKSEFAVLSNGLDVYLSFY